MRLRGSPSLVGPVRGRRRNRIEIERNFIGLKIYILIVLIFKDIIFCSNYLGLLKKKKILDNLGFS